MQEPAAPLIPLKVEVAGSRTGFIGTDPPHLNPARTDGFFRIGFGQPMVHSSLVGRVHWRAFLPGADGVWCEPTD